MVSCDLEWTIYISLHIGIRHVFPNLTWTKLKRGFVSGSSDEWPQEDFLVTNHRQTQLHAFQSHSMFCHSWEALLQGAQKNQVVPYGFNLPDANKRIKNLTMHAVVVFTYRELHQIQETSKYNVQTDIAVWGHTPEMLRFGRPPGGTVNNVYWQTEIVNEASLYTRLSFSHVFDFISH